MKPSPLTTLSFFLLINLPLLAFSQVVKDSYGRQIFPGLRYNLLPIYPANGGGLKLARTGNSPCPVTVLQNYSYVPGPPPFPEEPMHFQIPGISIGIIFQGTPLVVDFRDIKPKCASSATLAVFEDKKLGISYVGIGGPKDHPGATMIYNGTFNFQSFGKAYKLVHCVNRMYNCMDIGSYDLHEGGRRLVLTKNKPLELIIVLLSVGNAH